MPELPEVETVRLMLLKSLPRTGIVDIKVLYPKIIRNVTVDDFIRRLKGAILEDVKRKGKYLIFIFDQEYLISHLRMEGKYHFASEYLPAKHDHILFIWSNTTLAYNDTRKFGTMHLYHKTTDIYNVYPLKEVAIDANDEGLSSTYLQQKLGKKNIAIKSALLDQSVISGLGNIYVDEVLFRSRINPLKKASEISLEETQKIIIEAKHTLEKAITLGGTTIKSFSSGSIHGRFQNELQIHNQKICSVCGMNIKKIIVGGRGTYYCESCQKL